MTSSRYFWFIVLFLHTIQTLHILELYYSNALLFQLTVHTFMHLLIVLNLNLNLNNFKFYNCLLPQVGDPPKNYMADYY